MELILDAQYINARYHKVGNLKARCKHCCHELLQELGWETLQARRKHQRITTLYKMEHNIIDIPLDQYIIHNTRCSRKHNSQFLQIRHSSNTFGKSFFPTTAKEWNALPSDIISSSSIESFKTKLSKYLLDH